MRVNENESEWLCRIWLFFFGVNERGVMATEIRHEMKLKIVFFLYKCDRYVLVTYNSVANNKKLYMYIISERFSN